MAAITDYTSLVASMADWAERSDYDADEIIGLAEGEFRIYFGPSFAKETSTTLTFASGSATLPTGLVRVLSLVHATYGGLTEASAGGVREQRVWDTSGIPSIYALQDTTIITAASYDGDLTLDYESTLAGLSGSNATNWLITYAPQSYLSMCLSFIKAWGEDYQGAAVLKAASLKTLDDLGMQATVAQQGRASVRIPGFTP